VTIDISQYSLAKALHMLGVTLWIGGVAFVTFILIPAIQKMDSIKDQYSFFEKIEHRFAWQSRFTTLLTGLSGIYLVDLLDIWDRFQYFEFWWMHAMVLIWVLFSLMLFLFEPFFLHKYFLSLVQTQPKRLMAKVYYLHLFLIIMSLITILGAMIGTH
jgi:uncharacterized membrane protein